MGGFGVGTTGTIGVPAEGLGVEVGYFSFVFTSHRLVRHYGGLDFSPFVCSQVVFVAPPFSGLVVLRNLNQLVSS